MQLARGRVREARAIVSAVVACDEVTVSACVKESGELKRFFVFSMVEGGKTREMPGGVHPPRRTRSNRYLQAKLPARCDAGRQQKRRYYARTRVRSLYDS